MSRSFSLTFLALCLACGAPKPQIAAPEPIKIYAASPERGEGSLADFANRQKGEYYYSVYFSGMKVGWRALRISLEKSADGLSLVYDDDTLFSMSLNGQILKSTAKSRCVYDLTHPGLITSCVKEENSDNDKSSSLLTLKDGRHVATVNFNGHTKEYTLPPSKDTLSLAKALDDWVFADRTEGDTFDIVGLNVDGLRKGHQSLDSAATMTFLGRSTVRWREEEVSLTRVRSLDESGITTEFEMLPSGAATLIQAGPLEFRLEDEEAMTDFAASSLDMVQTISSNLFLGDPKELSSLTLILKSPNPFHVPETKRQRIVSAEGQRIVLELLPEFLSTKHAPLSEEEKARYTSPTLLIQSDNSDIRRLAQSIIGSETDPVRQLDRLQNWVFLNIAKSYGRNTSSALTVLENRAGDCTELTLLFTALARSVGIPARELTGLIYDDLNNVFGWHAWAEAHDGNQWISVDPTWNELFANATHIRLSKDDEDMASVSLLNSLEIEILAFETNR